MVIDTGCNDIVVTGDFNLNMFNNISARKINLLCSDFGMHQSITEPTHYTERSEPSLIDLILVHNPDSLVASGVGDPFLEQNLRFHCPIFGLLKFPKTKVKSYTRQIWNYALGNYDLLRAKTFETDWDSLRHASLDTYVINFTNHILELAKGFICKRKRAYRKAKRTDLGGYETKSLCSYGSPNKYTVTKLQINLNLIPFLLVVGGPFSNLSFRQPLKQQYHR